MAYSNLEITNYIDNILNTKGPTVNAADEIRSAMSQFGVSTNEIDKAYNISDGYAQNWLAARPSASDADKTASLIDQMRIDYKAQMDAIQQNSTQQMSTLSSALEQLRIDSQPKQVSSKTYRSGIVGNTTTGKTLATNEIDKRREAINKSFLGAKQMRIKLANDGVASSSNSGVNSGSTIGLAI